MSEIEYPPPSEDGAIFISYRRVDTQWQAKALYEEFRKAFPGVRVFMDIEAIDPGDDFVEAIERQVDCCGVMIAVIGNDWLSVKDPDGKRRIDNSLDFVRIEIRRGIERKIRVIPVLVDGTRMPRPDDLPEDIAALSRRQAVKLDVDRFRGDADAIVAGVEKALDRHRAEVERLSVEDLSEEVRRTSPEPASVLTDEVIAILKQTGFNASAIAGAAFERIEKGQPQVAEALIETALQHLGDDLATDSATERLLRLRLAEAHLDQGLAERAEQEFIDLAPPDDAEDKTDSFELTRRFYLARAQLEQGKVAEAEAALRELLPIREEVLGARHPDTLNTRFTIARAQLEQGKAAEAEASLRELLPIQKEVKGARHPDTLTTRSAIAHAQLGQGKAAEAEAALRELLPVEEEVKGARHPNTLVTLLAIAQAQLGQGKAAEAEAALRALLPVEEEVRGTRHPNTLSTRSLWAKALIALDRKEEARAVHDGLLDQLREAGLTPDHRFIRRAEEVEAALAGDETAASLE